MRKKKVQQVDCPYCNQPAHLQTGDQVYDHRPDLAYLWFWVCEPCDARVGCHKNSSSHHPLGRLASAKLRGWKVKAHASFDKLWKSPHMDRTEAYAWLASVLNIESKHCHIAMFNVMYCQKTVAYCDSFMENSDRFLPENREETLNRIEEDRRRGLKRENTNKNN